MKSHECMTRLWSCAVFLLAAGAALPAPAEGKIPVFAIENSFTSLDPYDTNSTNDQAACKSFYQGLFGFDKDMKLQKVLAESYTASQDGLTYTIKLRKDVQFHDGTPFNAAAVKAVFDRVTDPENKLKRYGLFANIAKTEAVDDHTARFTLKKPFSAFINQLGHPSSGMISPAALAKYGRDIKFHPVGTGPFMFVEWKQPDYMKVEKNPHYWKKGYPKIDGILWKCVPDSNTRTAMIQTGEANYISVPAEHAQNLQQNPKLDVIIGPGISTYYVSINTYAKPYDDVRVRQALNYAVNKEALAKAIFYGHATPLQGPVPANIQYGTNVGSYPFDLAKAKKLLAEAGHPNGFETELWGFNDSSSTKAMQFIQQQLSQVGIKARITPYDGGQRVQMIENIQKPEDAKVRLTWGSWSSSTGEADWGLRPLFSSSAIPPKGMKNFSYYSNPTFDGLLEQALATTDDRKKASIYKQAQEIIFKDAPWVFGVQTQVIFARTKDCKGVFRMPDESLNFDEAEFK